MRQHPDVGGVDLVWRLVLVLVVFGIVVYSVGQVLLRGPADSEVPRSGGSLMAIGGALVVTGGLLALAHAVLGLF